MNNALRSHWPEYLIEAAFLGLFMVSASVFTMLVNHPDSPVIAAFSNPFFRRTLVGIAMGLTAIGMIFSPLGKRSGAHMNPAVTLTFLRLGKIKPWDAAGYVLAQFIGGDYGSRFGDAVGARMVRRSNGELHCHFARGRRGGYRICG